MTAPHRLLRIFLASPRDVSAERECVHEVVSEFNRPGGQAAAKNITIQILEARHVPPGMGRAQQLILDHFPPEDWDVFVGILWQRFGSPTGAISQRSGRPLESGTQEEFEQALAAWRSHGRPDILVYRCLRAPDQPLDRIDTHQLERVNTFLKQFEHDGEHPGLVHTFESPQELRGLLLQALAKAIEKVATDTSEDAGHPPSKSLTPGICYQMALLKVDVVRHSELLEMHGEAGGRLLDAFDRYVDRLCIRHGGFRLNWDGDGGIYAFEGPAHRYLAVLAGIELIQGLLGLTLDRTINPQHIPFQIRLAGHAGEVHYRTPTGSIHSSAVNLVAHLEERLAKPGEFCVTGELLQGLEPEIQRLFGAKGLYGEQVLSVFPCPARPYPLATPELDGLIDAVRAHAEFLARTFQRTSPTFSPEECRSIRDAFEEVYDSIQYFCDSCGEDDVFWSKAYRCQVVEHAANLQTLDEQVWASLQQALEQAILLPESQLGFQSLLQVTAGRRAWVKAALDQIHLRLGASESLIPEGASRGSVNGKRSQDSVSTAAAIERLLKSDDPLQEDQIAAELLVGHSPQLVHLLVQGSVNGGLTAVIDRLWARADLVLIEDRYRNVNLGQGALLDALASHPADNQRFSTVQHFLASFEKPERALLSARLSAVGLSREEIEADCGADAALQRVLRCLLLGHPNAGIRSHAGAQLDWRHVWPMLIHPCVPLHAVRELALRLVGQSDLDLQRMFFDCARSRLVGVLEFARSRPEFEAVRPILLAFSNFEIFTEDAYWRRLGKLFRAFITQSRKWASPSRALENQHALLKERWERKRQKRSPIPQRWLDRTTLSVHRFLARESCYREYFVCHPTDSIALEILPALKQADLHRWLPGMRSFNGRLLAQLCEERMECRERPLLTKILHHPKCPMQFAMRHLPRLQAEELKRLAADRTALSTIREKARAQLVDGP